MNSSLSRRAFAAGAAFTIVPRHVLGGAGYVPPSDKINFASIGLGRQGMAITMDLLQRPEIQVVAVCDCNKGSLEYAEYGKNALLNSARRLLGAGYENWGADLASPGDAQLTHSFKTSLGMGGREPAKRVIEAYYGAHKPSGSAYSGCTAYADFRELLEKHKDLDAVYVATPDHWHAPIAIAAMRKHKHVLGQKPMTHSIGEARRMAETAREMKVCTSVTVANPSTPQTRQIAAWVADGAIGTVREVHNWSGRPYWPQGVERPSQEQPVPANLDWDMWVGPAPARPYNKAYLPFVWRGWYDFGCGSLGDMGCYSFAGYLQGARPDPARRHRGQLQRRVRRNLPAGLLHHPALPRQREPRALRFHWYDGGLRPVRPEILPPGAAFGVGREGVMYVGDKGVILGGFNGQRARIYPESIAKNYGQAVAEGNGDDPIDQLVRAIKGGPAPAASFETQQAVTETILLGCLATRVKGEKLAWDSGAQRFTNVRLREPVRRSALSRQLGRVVCHAAPPATARGAASGPS